MHSSAILENQYCRMITRKKHFLQHKEKHRKTKETYADEQKTTGKKARLVVAGMTTVIEIALKEIKKKRRQNMANIHSLPKLYAVH